MDTPKVELPEELTLRMSRVFNTIRLSHAETARHALDDLVREAYVWGLTDAEEPFADLLAAIRAEAACKPHTQEWCKARDAVTQAAMELADAQRAAKGALPTSEFASMNGMSLRDWFAGQAMQSLVPQWGDYATQDLAKDAYKIADAMLAAREVKP